MKLCINCVHEENKYCQREGTISQVTGVRNKHYSPCHEERYGIFPFDLITNTCGRRARFFKDSNAHLSQAQELSQA